MPGTIVDLLAAGAADAPAIAAADGRAPLTFAGLGAHAAAAVAVLNARGIGRGDRVAMVLPPGPEMAAAFIAVAAAATAAPLNPAFRAGEFRYFLGDLGARALLVAAGSASPATVAARELGIEVLEIAVPGGAPAGAFALPAPAAAAAAPARPGPATGSDTALVLHTSGTTSRPKIVPLTHANLCASAGNVAAALALGPHDRCLGIMPLFHIHGLVAAVLASLAAGGSVVCAPGFSALGFFAWLGRTRPTWYTAVPAMHQAILARAGRRREAPAGLRVVRSSSAPLPPQVMAELERTFGCPVIESYGMTEAAHQMTSNPLPPAPRKPGTVGPAAGPEVAILTPAGPAVRPGIAGEVVIRGANVAAGYDRNPEADAAAFVDGWFRTGDEGILDGDGYLAITGRLREFINRGGEKVGPREVEEVLLDHPQVAEAAVFALPHPKLGEAVAAAVVPAAGAPPEAQDLRAFAAGRLAAFKVPRTVVIVDALPRGATGKVSRIGLAARLGLAEAEA